MGVPKTPVPLEKRHEDDELLIDGNDSNNNDVHGHIFSAWNSFVFQFDELDFMPVYPFRSLEVNVRSIRSALNDLRNIFLAVERDFDELCKSLRKRTEVYVNHVKAPKNSDEIRKSLLLMYHEFRVFYSLHPPLMLLRNVLPPEHKMLLRCSPSHFWQFLV